MLPPAVASPTRAGFLLGVALLLGCRAEDPLGPGGSGGADASAVSVDPSSTNLQVGSSVKLTATVRDTAGQVIDNPVVSWASADTTLATVDQGGTVTAIAVGSVAIVATHLHRSCSRHGHRAPVHHCRLGG